MGKISIIQNTAVQYLGKEQSFRPGEAYPEYPFPGDLSSKGNGVYAMVRQGLAKMGFDVENTGTSRWNPLGKLISPGNRVLIKPNLVLDKNHSNEGEECLYTHPSLVAAMIDYACIALQGKGEIIVADAPVQSCDFENLINKSGYRELIAFYEGKGVNISLRDFRGITSRYVNGVVHATPTGSDKPVRVELGGLSVHAGLADKQMDAARITQYDSQLLKRHHQGDKHEYLVARELLDADVIINMPKPKTHRKAGVTSALKNFVGITCRKECLPHHRIGDPSRGGDEYLAPSWIKRTCACLLDKQNSLLAGNKYKKAKTLGLFIRAGYMLSRLLEGNRHYREGSWYGNDTIWRTIMDLNRIVLYADQAGNIQDKPQRKILCVGDMIVVGEKEGPLAPSPKQAGIIVIGDNCVCFDEVVAAIMGMDAGKIPSIKNARVLKDGYCLVTEGECCRIISNNPAWDGKEPKEIGYDISLKLTPSAGWKGHIESGC